MTPSAPSSQNRPGTVERAYQLANEGKTISEIRRGLSAEHYIDARAQLWGAALVAGLRRVARAANEAAAIAAPPPAP